MKKYTTLLMTLFITLLFTSCLSRTEPRKLLDNEYLEITQTGGKIDVYDVESNITYTSIYAIKTRQNGLQSLTLRLIRRPCELNKDTKKLY